MNNYQGNIFTGEITNQDHSFYLTKVKHLDTQSHLTEKNVKQLYSYMTSQSQTEDTCALTLNDQMPILLTQEEMQQVIDDLDEIIEKL